MSDAKAVFYSKSVGRTRKRPTTDWMPSSDGKNYRCRFHGRWQHFHDGVPSSTSDFQIRPLADPDTEDAAAAACHI